MWGRPPPPRFEGKHHHLPFCPPKKNPRNLMLGNIFFYLDEKANPKRNNVGRFGGG